MHNEANENRKSGYHIIRTTYVIYKIHNKLYFDNTKTYISYGKHYWLSIGTLMDTAVHM